MPEVQEVIYVLPRKIEEVRMDRRKEEEARRTNMVKLIFLSLMRNLIFFFRTLVVSMKHNFNIDKRIICLETIPPHNLH